MNGAALTSGRLWARPSSQLPATRRILLAIAAVAIVIALVTSMMLLGASMIVPAAAPAGSAGPIPAPVTSAPHLPVSASAAGHSVGQGLNAVRGSAPAVSPYATSTHGTFFLNQPLPFGPTPMCTYYGTCSNGSEDTSVVYSSTGVLATAYTDFTNASPCANVSNYAQTEVGISVSTTLGTTWSPTQILGNTNCSLANQYADAWQPSLTALANGTLVVAYIVYNLTSYTSAWYTAFGMSNYWNVPWAALALSESYNGGSTWTTPQILNASANPGMNASNFLPMRPWIDAIGNTVYVTWMNYTEAPGYNYFLGSAGGSAQVHLLVSTDGGATWGSQIDLPNEVTSGNPNAGINPSLMISPTGNLYVTFATNWTFYFSYPTGCSTTCVYDAFTANIVVGSSSNNGTTFTWSDAATSVLDIDYNYAFYYRLSSEWLDPSPVLAWNPVDGSMYATWGQGTVISVCPSTYCYTNYGETIYITTSTDGGATWTPEHLVSSQFTNPLGNQAYNPAIAVDNNGVVDVAASFLNYSQVYTQYEGFVNSTDDGATFGNLHIVTNNTTFYPAAPMGLYSQMVNANGTMVLGWTLVNSTVAYGGWPGYGAYPEAQAAELYTGTGIAVSFTETGLATGINWGVDMMGNLVNGTAGTTLTVTGVPPSYTVSWSALSVAGGYGIRYFSSSTPSSPSSFTAATTVTEAYSEQILVNVTSNPYYPTCLPTYCSYPSWNYTYYMDFNYNITPGPSAAWVPVGTAFTENVTPVLYGFALCPFCQIQYTELSFLSWTGNGAGSVNTTSQNISVTPSGPVNETANFRLDGTCLLAPGAAPTCTQFNQTLVFQETGLPANVTWSVTIQSSTNGQVATASSAGPTIAIASNATLGVVNYTVWTIPSGTPGLYWVGVGTPGSPVVLPGDRVVTVAFTLENPSAATFGVQFAETGLPNDTAWSIDLGNNLIGVQSSSFLQTTGGGTQSVGAPDVFGTNGTSYWAQSVTLQPFVMNATWVNYTTLPASVSIDGGASVWVNFAPEYWVGVSASTGGNTSTSSQWVHTGGSLTLSESAQAGSYFVGWTGSGPGSVTTSTPSPTVHPSGPITELATFAPIPASRWVITVHSVGVPTGANVSFTVGNQTYSAGPWFNVTGLLSGNYELSVPYSYLNSSDLTRFVPTSWETSFTVANSNELVVGSNGSLTLTYATQFQATLASSGSGTISPAAGNYWWDSGSSNVLTATPSAGYRLAQWSGSQSSTALSFTVLASGPINETAQFVVAPAVVPATFDLAVTETGLPANTPWSVAVGTTGASGTGATLTVSGLNGSYLVTLPTVLIGSDTRYVLSSAAPGNQTVTSNVSLDATFSPEYLVTIAGSYGGTVGPSTAWTAGGSSITLSAVANSGYTFSGWAGTGPGAYTGPNAGATVNVSGPITESATFTLVYQQQSQGSSTDGLYLAIGILIGLLAVGLVVGILISRRRPPSASSAATPMQTEEPAQEAMYGEGGNPPT